jgi:hypothetical protein
MKDFIEYLVKRLVDNPDQVQITELNGSTTSVYELRVGEGDFGKVIGKHGRTIQALRTILSGSATKENKRVVLELLE